MSNQRPIFNNGLYGKANRTVMNAFMDSADALAANQPGRWHAVIFTGWWAWHWRNEQHRGQ
jgi:hypothetical protein